MLEHSVKFERGFNCIDYECVHNNSQCKPNSMGSHGKRGLYIRFTVKGEEGAIQFVISTGLVPRPITKNNGIAKWSEHETYPADLGYHSKSPMYEGQELTTNDCSFLDGKPCYYDGSSLQAELPMYVLVNAGEDALWNYLDGYYCYTFRGGDFPKVVVYEKPLRKKEANHEKTT